MMYDLEAILATEPERHDHIGEVTRHGKRRDIESIWRVGPGVEYPNSDHPGDEGTILLCLTSHHWKDLKQFSTKLRVNLESEHDDGRGGTYKVVRTSVSYGLGGEVYDVSTVNCPRFSAKAMREHHERSLQLVRYSIRHAAQSLRQGVERYCSKVEA